MTNKLSQLHGSRRSELIGDSCSRCERVDNSTSSWVELCRYKRPFINTLTYLLMSFLWINIYDSSMEITHAYDLVRLPIGRHYCSSKLLSLFAKIAFLCTHFLATDKRTDGRIDTNKGTAPPTLRTVESWRHSSLQISGVVCCSRKTTTKCFWEEASTFEDNATELNCTSRNN